MDRHRDLDGPRGDPVTHVVCRECEAHVSWCDNPDTHTHVDLEPVDPDDDE